MKRVIFLVFVVALVVIRSAIAEDYNTIEGVSGSIDKKRRNPVLSVGTKFSDTSVSILADAFVPHDEYKEYPLQFDFYINRALYASQIRSKELPGPVGVVVTSDVVPLPFNYSVVVKVLHPNRTFTTVLNGAATTPSDEPTFNCSVQTIDIEGNDVTYAAADVAIPTVSNDAFSSSFTGVSSSAGNTSISVQASTTSDGATGTLTIGDESFAVEGSVTTSDEAVSSFSFTGTEDEVSVSCS